MKKKNYFLLLILFLIPFSVSAETDLSKIHDDISQNNKITIKSIPFNKYKESKYFEACTTDTSYDGIGTEESCSNTIYRYIITSHINKEVQFPEDVSSFVECDAEENTCNIELYSSTDTLTETYDVEFIEVENNNIYNLTKNAMNDLKKKYELDDMGYINQLINYTDVEKFYSKLQSSSEIFKLYPEIKDNIEKNPKIKFVSVFGAGGTGPLTLGSGGVVIAYYDDIAVGISDHFLYSTYKIVYIPENTENNEEEYAKAALKRIKEYINNENYEVSVTINEELTNLYCDGNFCNYAGYDTKIYQLTINDKSYNLGIAPADDKTLKKLKIKSKDYENDVSIETTSSDVPLDSSVKSNDVTDMYKNHGYKKVYDINLYSDLKDENITTFKDGIVVKLPLEDNVKEEKINIYYIEEDGSKGEKYEATVEIIDNKKYAVFTTTHFSTYAVEDVVEVQNPETSDEITRNVLLATISVISIIGILVLKKKKYI